MVVDLNKKFLGRQTYFHFIHFSFAPRIAKAFFKHYYNFVKLSSFYAKIFLSLLVFRIIKKYLEDVNRFFFANLLKTPQIFEED